MNRKNYHPQVHKAPEQTSPSASLQTEQRSPGRLRMVITCIMRPLFLGIPFSGTRSTYPLASACIGPLRPPYVADAIPLLSSTYQHLTSSTLEDSLFSHTCCVASYATQWLHLLIVNETHTFTSFLCLSFFS